MPRRPRSSVTLALITVVPLLLAGTAAGQAPAAKAPAPAAKAPAAKAPAAKAPAPAAKAPAAKAPALAASQPGSQPATGPAASQPASGPAARVAARPDGVAGVGADGAELWRCHHAGLALRPGDAIVGPLTAAGRTVYAVRADLLEVDAERGVIVRRTRFPATIAELAVARDAASGDPRLTVTLQYLGDFPRPASPDRVVVHHRLGDPAPGRIFWQAIAWVGAQSDARELAPALKAEQADPAAIPPEARERMIEALRAAAARDLTNPHYHALLGALLQGAGQGAAATRAFAAAADLPAAHWADLLRVATTLEDAGAREPARRAFARGVQGLETAGVRVELLRSAVGKAILMPPPRRALAAAFKAKDVGRVDEIAARAARVFPRGEGGAFAWAHLASWMKEQGKPDLAARWRDRARRGGTLFGASPGRDLAGEVDARLPFILGALAGAVLIAFVRGLRRGGAARSGTGLARLPIPGAADLAVILVPLLAALAVDLGTSDRIASISRYASAPLGLFNDALDAPDVERWVAARLEPGPAKDLLLAAAVDAGRATRAGGRDESPPLDVATYHEAIEHPGTLGARLTRSVSGSITALAGEMGPGKAGLLRLVRGLGAAALAALALFVFGFVLARLFPLLQALSWLIPGGPKSLSIPAGLVTALAAAGIFGNYLPAALSSLAVPSFFKLYGFEAIAPADGGVTTTAPLWVFAALGLALILHIWGITRDLKHRTAEKPSQG